MKILINECLPKKLKGQLTEFETITVPEMGWAGKTNGTLLTLMQGEFDVFITIDGNLQYQQNLADASIAVIVISAQSNRFEDLLPIVPAIRDALRDERIAGNIIQVGEDK